MPEYNKEIPYSLCFAEKSIGETLQIQPEEIRSIVHGFYSKVRDDDLLGPVFADEMTEDWEHHLTKMVNFWTAILFSIPLYKGNPLLVHSRLKEIGNQHFDRWLALFKQTLIEVCPDETHIAAFYQRACNMRRAMTAALAL